MNCGLRLFSEMMIGLFILTCLAGCTSIRTTDTHNITAAVQSYNTWTAGQKELDTEQRGSRLDELSAATARFDKETSSLTYSNETMQVTKDHLAIMSQYMKIYAIHTGNARQYLIEYVNNAEAYVAPDDPEYWNENYRTAATNARTGATAEMDKGDAALNDLLREAKELEKLQ